MTEPSNAAPATILVVDDTLANLHLLIHLLSKEGFKIRPVQNGQDALTAARTSPPDLILLDIMMPGLDGYEVCSQLKADEITREVPVIFLSALESIEDKVRAFNAGGVDYITKPFRREEVLARVRTHLALLQARRDLKEEIDLRQKIQADLLEALRLASLGTMAAGVAHELNSPLQVITGTSDDLVNSLEENLKDPARLRQKIERIQKSSWRCVRITEALRTYAAPVLQSRVPQDVRSMAEEALGDLSERWEDQPQIEIQLHIPADLPPLPCDRAQVVHTLHSLFENALDALAGGGRVSLTASYDVDRRSWQIDVADDGIGMTPEMLARAFDPFFTTKPVGQGVGLDLSTVRAVLQAHGGEATLQSTPRQGTVASLVFPAAGQLMRSGAQENVTGRYDG
jgi:two-component system, NtrC family, sensor kinase